jgi:transcriptional regulator with XRE-family HTH domain
VPATLVKEVLVASGITTINRGKKWAELTGVVSTETVSQIIRGNRKNVGFDTADKILVALDSPELWYTKFGGDHYYGPNAEQPKWLPELIEWMKDGFS